MVFLGRGLVAMRARAERTETDGGTVGDESTGESCSTWSGLKSDPSDRDTHKCQSIDVMESEWGEARGVGRRKRETGAFILVDRGPML